jgi:hypothetical protein
LLSLNVSAWPTPSFFEPAQAKSSSNHADRAISARLQRYDYLASSQQDHDTFERWENCDSMVTAASCLLGRGHRRSSGKERKIERPAKLPLTFCAADVTMDLVAGAGLEPATSGL